MSWDYASSKKPCAVCGKGTVGIGQTLPFCAACELEWADAPERAEAGTARARFVARMRRALEEAR